jgi:phosphoribosylamine--glycine ligase
VNILLIGSGGREHALAWKIAQSPLLSTLFIAPGNPGTAQLGKNVALPVHNHAAIIDFCLSNAIELVVVGPEQPLVDGIADALNGAGIPVFGPRKMAALLEGSKSYAKAVMAEAGVPTAAYQSFDSIEAAVSYCRTDAPLPIVVKLDGLAAGKGVFICESREEAVAKLSAVKDDPALAGAAAYILVEEFMKGEEVSVFAICDGNDFVLLPPVQDHKRIGDNDTGPNTGGMGAYAPAPVLTKEGLAEVGELVVAPILKTMRKRGCPYVGVLYCGLMITALGPKVVEFNCRFGDPECQVLMPLLKSDLVPLMLAAVNGNIAGLRVEIEPGYACTVVLAAEGYPSAPAKGDALFISAEQLESTYLFFSGVAEKEGNLVTAGGRVMNCVGCSDSLKRAIERAYKAAEKVSFRGKYMRTDIGRRGLAHLGEV